MVGLNFQLPPAMESALSLDSKVPLRHWLELSDYDRHRYNELRLFFRQQQKDCLRERRTSPFPGEITSILAFTDQPTPGRDSRCIVAGIACLGPDIAVNTQQFKHLVGRCKSSIDGGFQQIGYDVVRNRAAARERIARIIPALRVESVRQWTVRCASDDASACFYSASLRRPPWCRSRPVCWSCLKPKFSCGIEGLNEMARLLRLPTKRVRLSIV
jgi:hypothetical protein